MRRNGILGQRSDELRRLRCVRDDRGDTLGTWRAIAVQAQVRLPIPTPLPTLGLTQRHLQRPRRLRT